MEGQEMDQGKVLIKTTRGDIIINLFSSSTPQHCTYFMDWVNNVIGYEDVPCSQRVIKNFYIQFYFDEFDVKRLPTTQVESKFNRPGLCAFSNNNFNHFIITLDPCDAFNTKYTIFGEVSEDTVPSLISINTCETDEEIQGDIYLITGIQILEPLPGYKVLRSSLPIPPPISLDSSITIITPPLADEKETEKVDATQTEDENLQTDDPKTPVITPDTSLDMSSFASPIPSPSHPSSHSTSVTTTSSTFTITSTNVETTHNGNNKRIHNDSSEHNNSNNNNNNSISHSIHIPSPMQSPMPSPMGLSRRSSSAFHAPSPKRPRIEPSPKLTPVTRSSTLLMDQQQCLMAPHFGSALHDSTCHSGGGAGFHHPLSSLHPLASLHHPFSRISRSYSAPDVRMQFQPKWPKRLVIVRHGQSEQNACLDLYQDDIDTLLALASVRDCDIKLTDFGKWQAEQTGKYLANSEQFDICFVSPAVNTAELIAKELPYKLKIYKDNWLREKEFGRLHGLNEKTVRERFPLEYEIRNRDGKYWYRFPGGENYCDVEMRIHCFLEKLSRDYAGRSVLVVTHQVPYKLFRALLQNLDEDGVLKLEAVHNCGVQEYLLDRTKSNGGRLKLKTFNYAAYKASDCPPHLASGTKKSTE